MTKIIKNQKRSGRWPNSREVVAEICGYTPEHISRIMHGRVKKDRQQVMKEMDLFKQKIDEYIQARKSERHL